LFKATDSIIAATIDNTTGYIANILHDREQKTIQDALQEFIHSHTYELLANKETGLYWESPAAVINLYLEEKGHPLLA